MEAAQRPYYGEGHDLGNDLGHGLDLGALLLDLLELHPRRLAALQLLTLEVVPQRAPVARDDG